MTSAKRLLKLYQKTRSVHSFVSMFPKMLRCLKSMLKFDFLLMMCSNLCKVANKASRHMMR